MILSWSSIKMQFWQIYDGLSEWAGPSDTPPSPNFDFDRSISTVQGGGAYYAHYITNGPSPQIFRPYYGPGEWTE